jgi:hypothetical protein
MLLCCAHMRVAVCVHHMHVAVCVHHVHVITACMHREHIGVEEQQLQCSSNTMVTLCTGKAQQRMHAIGNVPMTHASYDVMM